MTTAIVDALSLTSGSVWNLAMHRDDWFVFWVGLLVLFPLISWTVGGFFVGFFLWDPGGAGIWARILASLLLAVLSPLGFGHLPGPGHHINTFWYGAPVALAATFFMVRAMKAEPEPDRRLKPVVADDVTRDKQPKG